MERNPFVGHQEFDIFHKSQVKCDLIRASEISGKKTILTFYSDGALRRLEKATCAIHKAAVQACISCKHFANQDVVVVFQDLLFHLPPKCHRHIRKVVATW